ncbi:MAG: hypothetical protein CBB97_07170 [Candidatus Endolissoclinum sp. TMED37]|nr:MAG: hypothetical protein CBB97_07170 [Candidatus Endolissoclinum sp. TMED37]|tara:strand:+ start:408 stop:701 length:294 start_codon:yes stop_codon:yes gene_type:complete
MNILDFKTYKEKQELKYLDDEYLNTEQQEFASEMDSMAEVMEMSTDEIISELTIRANTENDFGLRSLSTSHLVDELTQRLLAMEYVIYCIMMKNTKK